MKTIPSNIETKSVAQMPAPNTKRETHAIKADRFEKADRNGVPVGIFEGYASTFGNVDRADDVIEAGAFDETIAEHRARNRPIRMLFQHGYQNLIGGFPIEDVKVDNFGLFVKGEVNLESDLGRRTFSLMKQGVLTDMSIGFSITDWEIKDGLRIIKKAKLWEISAVDEPCNQLATITAVKRVAPFQELPIAAPDAEWDESKALERVCETTDAKKACLLFDEKADDSEKFKFLIADIVDGKMTIIPKAVYIAQGELAGGKFNVSEAEEKAMAETLERYAQKIKGAQDPADVIDVDTVKEMSPRDLETELKNRGFSKEAAKFVVSRKKKLDDDEETGDDSDSKAWEKVLGELEGLKKSFEN